MLYKDNLYGEIKIDEPVILDLIESPGIQRLKNIDQIGYPEPHFQGIGSFSRFEHSLGVFILLKKFGASLEEQVAGLIHDVSHAVFSHCADYALGSDSEKTQSHQDNIFEEFVKKSEIPAILQKYNIDVDFILNEHNFSLLEKELPDLCADRIDYSLRNGFHYRAADKESINYFMDNLYVQNGNWIFKNYESAKRFAEYFLKMNRIYYSDLNSATMFRTVGDALKHALKKKYIDEEDLYTTDNQVLDKIKSHLEEDEKLKILFNRMDGKIKVENNHEDYEARVFCKSRVVNPLCKYNDKVLRVSDIDKNWAEVVKKESQPKEYFLKFEK